MTLASLKTALESVNDNAFSGKVAYRAFPVGAAPSLPFICFMEVESNNFVADSKVYHKITEVNIELYTDHKDPTTEGAIEKMLDDNLLVWDKSEFYITSENMLQVVYGIEI
ncbi:MAG: hypothetical protein IKM87_02015 [Clostridia bacterium]|nr:hypothetical protein [Clostridia bacterium]